MASTRKPSAKQKAAAKRRNAEVRAHYRRYLINKPNGKKYNPILDEPDTPPEERHPLNIRGLVHGTLAGYRDGGCTYCDACVAAHRAEQERFETNQVAKRLDDHRGRAKQVLADALPGTSSAELDDAAELVVSTHRVRYRARALLDYEPKHIELALSNWALSHNIGDWPPHKAIEIAETIHKELTTP